MPFAALAKLWATLGGWRFDDGDDAAERTPIGEPVEAIPCVEGQLAETLRSHDYRYVRHVRQAGSLELAEVCTLSRELTAQVCRQAHAQGRRETVAAIGDRAARHEGDEPLRFDDQAAVDLEEWQ